MTFIIERRLRLCHSTTYIVREAKMIDNFEDDTHYCIKCHLTIVGLENYINHRKSKCGKELDESKKSDDLASELLEKPLNLEADDFFSSLELQSSAKKSINHSPGGKSFSGILTRSKAIAVLQANSQSKDSLELNNLKNNNGEWITETEHNKTSTRKEVSLHQSYEEIEEDSDDYEYEDGDLFEDDEEEEDVPPRSFTGGKWKPTSSPVQWQRTHDDNYWIAPQPHHTGGKWKPQAFNKTEETYDVPPPSFTGSKWTPSRVLTSENKIKSKMSIFTASHEKWDNVPPPEHTKGKWKPTQSFFSHHEEEPKESPQQVKWKVNEETPPSSYTQGKWKPEKSQVKPEISPLRKSSGTVQYWCRPCDRRLASKIVYERHLKSELHFKRTLNDSEFDDSPYLNTSFVTNKRKSSKSPEYSARTDIKTTKTVSGTKTQGRSRKKIFITCEGCDSKVNCQLIGKHLISHYHCRKTDMNLLKSQLMVLENIHSIILQSPYQCSPCKFYCNTHEWFLQHWLSESHNAIILTPESLFWCCVCKFRAKNSKAMFDHLSSNEHNDINLAINRSVPVVIKKFTPIKCPTCLLEFKLNIELRKHNEKENHSHSLTSTDSYQNKCECTQCDAVLKSRRALQRHQMFSHNAETFICSVCSLNFNSKLEAKHHRNTPEHRCAVEEKNRKDVSKTCQHCKTVLKNIVELREHLKENHPAEMHSCSKCGKSFIIPQDLAVHIRKNACSFENFTESKSNACDQCQFNTDSTSELLFHKVLHTEPLMVRPEDKSDESKKYPVAHYKCQICQKFYPKLSLRCHLRMHTNERPFVCTICNSGFVRKNNLILHMKNHDKKSISQIRNPSSKEEGERLHLCSTCGASFKKRSILQQHMTRHTGKLYNCVESDCLFSARSRAELKAHMITHSSGTPFNCQLCEYQGKSKQHLKRHMTIHKREKSYQCTQCSFTTRLSSHLKRHQRLHTGAKPFGCPHCDYSCNNLENLRKHVLQTNKHPGKCIYECKFCKDDVFGSNFAKEFKLHLMAKHSDVFLTIKDASNYVTQIYQNDNGKDETSIDSLDKECTSKSMEHQTDQILTQIQELTPKLNSSSAIESTILFTSITNPEASEHTKIHEELFPMLVSSKVGNSSELWNFGGNYDVEESGILIPFHSDRETLLNDHFQ